MAPRKKKSEGSGSFDFSKAVEDVFGGLKLPATNLQRGGLSKDALSSGSLTTDLILGGGWPPGMVSIPFGPEQGGKSTMAYFACKSAVEQGIPVFFFDFEGATDTDRIERLGLDFDAQDENGEPLFRYYNLMHSGNDAFIAMKRLMDRMEPRHKGPVQAVWFVDSIHAMVPKILDEDEESGIRGAHAKMMSDGFRLIKSRLAAKRCLLVATNQTRKNPDARFGNPEYEPGGEATKFYSDVRMRMSKTVNPWGGKSYVHEEPGWTGEGIDRYTYVNIKTVKHKAFSPNREAVLRIWFEENGKPGRGICPAFDAYEYLRLTGQIRRGVRKEKPALGKEKSCLILKWECKGERADETLYYWHEFKELLVSPEKANDPDGIRARCLAQLKSGDAFRMYYENLSGVSEEPEVESSEPVDDGGSFSLEE